MWPVTGVCWAAKQGLIQVRLNGKLDEQKIMEMATCLAYQEGYALVGGGRCVKSVKLETGQVEELLWINTDYITAMTATLDTIIVGMESGRVCVYDNRGRLQKVLPAHTKRVRSLCVDLQRKYLATAGDDQLIVVYDTYQFNCLFQHHSVSSVKSMTFYDHESLLFSSMDAPIKCLNIQTRQLSNPVRSVNEQDCLLIMDADRTLFSINPEGHLSQPINVSI
jgi:WD40 repeat protein